MQDGTIKDDLDSTLHKRLNAGLSTFSIAQLSLLVSAQLEVTLGKLRRHIMQQHAVIAFTA
jgi:hypothetical protein